MEYISKNLDYRQSAPSVITLGKFDGLHRGHELLIEKQKELCSLHNYKSVVFTFDIPPKPGMDSSMTKVITTNEEKRIVFEKNGIDILFECPFIKEIMCMEPEDFIKWIVDKFNVKYVVVGTDFGFGHNRSGNYHTLQENADKYNYEVKVIDKKQYNGRDISSTYIREEIEQGNIELVNKLLGYEYFIKSKVVHGKQLGRTIGIPTINMNIPNEKVLPPKGVYITKVEVADKWYMGVSNIGNKPTVGDNNPLGLETYLIDFCQDIYGKDVTVQFLKYLRPEMKFKSIDELKEQMNKDIVKTYKYYRNITHNIDIPNLC